MRAAISESPPARVELVHLLQQVERGALALSVMPFGGLRFRIGFGPGRKSVP